MSSTPLRSAALTLIACGACASAAGAAEVRITTPCVVTSGVEPPVVPIEGTGFTPGAEVQVFTNGVSAAFPQNPVADPAGGVAYTLFTPIGEYGLDHPVPLTLTDTAGVSASTTFLMVDRALALPARIRARRPVGIRAEGFPADKPVYLFAERRRRIRGVLRLGLASGPCGVVRTRTFVLPPRARDGVWRIGAGPSRDPADVLYVHRVRKSGRVIRNLGEER